MPLSAHLSSPFALHHQRLSRSPISLVDRQTRALQAGPLLLAAKPRLQDRLFIPGTGQLIMHVRPHITSLKRSMRCALSLIILKSFGSICMYLLKSRNRASKRKRCNHGEATHIYSSPQNPGIVEKK